MRLLILMLALACATATPAQVTRADVEAQKAATAEANAHLACALASEARQNLGVSEFGVVVGDARPNSARLAEIARRTTEAQRNHDIGAAILKGNNFLIKTSVSVATSLGTMPILGAIISESVSASLDEVMSVYEEEGRAAIRRNLKTSLEEFRRRTSPQQTAELLASPDPATFRARLESKVGNVFGTELDDLPADQQQIVNSFYDRELADLFTAGPPTPRMLETELMAAR